MGKLVDSIRGLALAWGAPGLFLVAFLDSSFLPLPGITDILLIVLVTRHEERMLLYALSTVVGSVVGCLTMHYVGRKGGEALLRKRFAGPRIERAMATLQRHGVMAVLIASLLPPPSPFKIFLLLAGAVGISAARVAIAITIGRAARYLTLGYLAVRYGGAAQTYLRENGAQASLIVVALLAVVFAVSLWSRTARRGKNR